MKTALVVLILTLAAVAKSDVTNPGPNSCSSEETLVQKTENGPTECVPNGTDGAACVLLDNRRPAVCGDFQGGICKLHSPCATGLKCTGISSTTALPVWGEPDQTFYMGECQKEPTSTS